MIHADENLNNTQKEETFKEDPKNPNDTTTKEPDIEQNKNSDNDEFAYSKHTSEAHANKTEQIKLEYPVPLKKQIIISGSTALISSIPIVVKIMNKHKDPNAPSVSYSDIADFMIYKIPDLIQIIKRKFYGTKIEKIATKFEMLAFAATLTPTIRNILMQYKSKGVVELDNVLASHLFVLGGEVLIPMIFNNDKIHAIFTRIIGPGIKNFILSNMINSPNPLVREIASAIPLAFLLGDKARYVYDSTMHQNQHSTGNSESVFNNNANTAKPAVQGNSFFDKLVNAAADAISNSGKNRYNYPNNYYGGNSNVYGSYYSNNGAGRSPWEVRL